ncbi:hypothetical protein HYV10_01190 [Candidatus Dependentiae bacterium]|nr:hypothetical protein [Candidatus Dependentiae bacterium]
MNKKIIIKSLLLIMLFEYSILYSKTKNIKNSEVNARLQTIITKINDLPETYRPTDIKKALKLMLQGKSIWNNINKNKSYSALEVKIDEPHAALIIKNSFDMSPDNFWVEIHNNQKIQQAIEQANIEFTREASNSSEYYMLFRMTYLKIMLNNDEFIKKIIDAYQQAIIALQWFLYAQTLLENEPFHSAVIAIPDKDLSIFYFLDGYAELISPRYRLYSALSIHSFWQSDAYTRITRHWKYKKLFKDAAFGINFKNHIHNNEYPLPLNNAHILFGTLNNNLTFIKWQKHGPHVTDIIKNKIQTNPEFIRSDKLSKDILLQFKSLFGHPLTRYQNHLITKDGISAMIQMLNNESRTLFINFLKKIKKYNMLDNNIRKGNEIILNPQRFKDFQTI